MDCLDLKGKNCEVLPDNRWMLKLEAKSIFTLDVEFNKGKNINRAEMKACLRKKLKIVHFRVFFE